MEYNLKNLKILITENNDHNFPELIEARFKKKTLEGTIKGIARLRGEILMVFKDLRIGPTNLPVCFSAYILNCTHGGKKYPIPEPQTKIRYRLNKIVSLNEIYENYIEK